MEIRQETFIETNPLFPAGPAEELFISGASIFEITVFEPPLQRVTIVGVNLPDPDTFGPYDTYVATLQTDEEIPEEIISFPLVPTFDESVWAGTTFLDFGGTLFPINAVVRPQSEDRVGPVILEGAVLDFDNNGGDNGDDNGDNGTENFGE